MKRKEINGCNLGLLNGKIFFFILLLIFTFSNCVKQNKKVESIRIFYLPETMLTPLALSNCDDIFLNYNLLKDTIITSKKDLNDIITNVNNLRISEDTVSYDDFRIRCTIKYFDNSKTIICLGALWGISCDGVKMEDDSTLLNTIKNIIYKK